MSKIILMMSVGSHQNATFCLSKHLLREGHTVIYAGAKTGVYNEDLVKNVNQQGFDYEIFDPFETGDQPNDRKDFTNQFHLFAQNLLDGDITNDFINRAKPDLIILDIHLPLYAIAFHILKIPIIFISTELLTERDLDHPPLTSSLVPRFDDSSRFEIKNAWEGTKKNLPKGVKYLASELARKGKFPFEEYLSEKCIVLFGLKFPEIILWPFEFEFGAKISFQQRINYIGCYNDLDRIEKPFDWTQIPNSNRPIIYVAMGTVLDHQALVYFFEKLAEAARISTEYEFIISTGRLYEKITNVICPANVHLYSYVPQIDVLKKSVLMVTLGGANSLKECILLEVPMLCYPFHSDQFGNATRLVFHKLGLRGNIFEDSPIDICSKIRSIIRDKSYKLRLSSFKKFFEFRESEHQKTLLFIESVMKAEVPLGTTANS
jgi:zeaxanthin glucosyltransferase